MQTKHMVGQDTRQAENIVRQDKQTDKIHHQNIQSEHTMKGRQYTQADKGQTGRHPDRQNTEERHRVYVCVPVVAFRAEPDQVGEDLHQEGHDMKSTQAEGHPCTETRSSQARYFVKNRMDEVCVALLPSEHRTTIGLQIKKLKFWSDPV